LLTSGYRIGLLLVRWAPKALRIAYVFRLPGPITVAKAIPAIILRQPEWRNATGIERSRPPFLPSVKMSLCGRGLPVPARDAPGRRGIAP
jgi:hypothetical protein